MDPRTRNLAYRNLVAIKMHLWNDRERERGEFAQENLWHAVQIELSCRARRRRRWWRDEKTKGKDGKCVSYSERAFKGGLNIVASLSVTRYRGKKGLGRWTKSPRVFCLTVRLGNLVIRSKIQEATPHDGWHLFDVLSTYISRVNLSFFHENTQKKRFTTHDMNKEGRDREREIFIFPIKWNIAEHFRVSR